MIMEIKGSSHVLDEFYKGRAEPLKPMSTKEYEKAVEGGYEDELGVVGRREIKVRVKEKERQGDF
nr:hypothetical protein [Pyrobaculum sp.]